MGTTLELQINKLGGRVSGNSTIMQTSISIVQQVAWSGMCVRITFMCVRLCTKTNSLDINGSVCLDAFSDF